MQERCINLACVLSRRWHSARCDVLFFCVYISPGQHSSVFDIMDSPAICLLVEWKFTSAVLVADAHAWPFDVCTSAWKKSKQTSIDLASSATDARLQNQATRMLRAKIEAITRYLAARFQSG